VISIAPYPQFQTAKA